MGCGTDTFLVKMDIVRKTKSPHVRMNVVLEEICTSLYERITAIIQ